MTNPLPRRPLPLPLPPLPLPPRTPLPPLPLPLPLLPPNHLPPTNPQHHIPKKPPRLTHALIPCRSVPHQHLLAVQDGGCLVPRLPLRVAFRFEDGAPAPAAASGAEAAAEAARRDCVGGGVGERLAARLRAALRRREGRVVRRRRGGVGWWEARARGRGERSVWGSGGGVGGRRGLERGGRHFFCWSFVLRLWGVQR